MLDPIQCLEYDAQIKNKTWRLVPRPKGANIINSMWLYKHKIDADGTPTRHKSRLIANGKTHEAGVDYVETFSPVVKPASIRYVLDVALNNGWGIRQLDVKNTFLHGTIDEDIYMHKPLGFVDKTKPHLYARESIIWSQAGSSGLECTNQLIPSSAWICYIKTRCFSLRLQV